MLPLAFGVILVALAIAFALLDLPQWVRDLSPYTHVPPLAGEGKVAPVLAVLAEASALGLAGLLTLRRRDLAVS